MQRLEPYKLESLTKGWGILPLLSLLVYIDCNHHVVAGKITNSLLSGTNENNVALATLNFDFCLLKIEAPAEFRSLATAFSTHRRNEAEEGLPHKTARRLGALFEDLIPSTPNLIAAYGKRVSEIVRTPGINPSGRTSHGPFEKFVGADGTSLWAAATSGVAAIGVYLLSCLLARTWDAKESISLWVELVASRKKEVEEAFQNNYIVSSASLMSARQDINREDLARWDHSTRSWLRRADQAKAWEQQQLALILKNVSLSVAGQDSTYASVIEVWRQAMLGIEALLSGKPLSISSGSLFLAIPAWHLFPDLIVLGKETTNVKFNDTLFRSSGIGTVGLQPSPPNDQGGIRWSLALSHFTYYGPPVVVENTQQFSRVSFRELGLIALGSLFSAWMVSSRDLEPSARWLLEIRALLNQSRTQHDDPKPPGICILLRPLFRAAQDLVKSQGEARLQNLQLLKYGVRRAKHFMVDTPRDLHPFFGICNAPVLAGLSRSNDVDCEINYLRRLAEDLGLTDGDAIIVYALDSIRTDNYWTPQWFEFATATPHTTYCKKLDSNGVFVTRKSHARWLYIRYQLSRPLDFHCPESMLLIRAFSSCEIEELADDRQDATARLRMAKIKEQGELCQIITGIASSKADPNIFSWPFIPNLFRRREHSEVFQCPSTMAEAQKTCDCFETNLQSGGANGRFDMRLVAGSWRFGLYVLKTDWRSDLEITGYENRAVQEQTKAVSPSAGLKAFSDAAIDPQQLQLYFGLLFRFSGKQRVRAYPGLLAMSAHHQLPISFQQSLCALGYASTVYRNLEGATISLKLVSRPLASCLWLPRILFTDTTMNDQQLGIYTTAIPVLGPWVPTPLTRSQAFACIANFETGFHNPDPEDLVSIFAICSEDSIFVAAVALSDPFDCVAPHEIRRLVGNIGQPGICLLVAPKDPRIRNLSDQYNIVAHTPYDSKRENNFKGTTLHLSFTNWTFPLEAIEKKAIETRTIDHDVTVVESIMSVVDRGKWVADLDILATNFDQLDRISTACDYHTHTEQPSNLDYISIDSWEELLDKPEAVGIFRAHGNWAARLAAVSILTQQGRGHCIGIFGPSHVCLNCLEEEYEKPTGYLRDYGSSLSALCID